MSYGGNSTSNSPLLLTEVESFDHLVTKYTSASGLVVYLYDLFLTFDDEISLFWNSSGGWLIKSLYLTNRYLPLMGLISFIVLMNSPSLNKTACRFTILSTATCQVFGALVAAAIFSLRVLTIYKSSFTVKALIILSFCSSALIMITLLFISLAWMDAAIDSINGMCMMNSDTTKSSYATGGLYLAPLLCEIVVMGATVRHALDTRRNLQTLQLSRASPVLQRLYNDGFAYFFIVFTFRIFSCCVWFLAPTNLKYFSDYFDYSLTSIAASRFFLALRQSISQSVSLSDMASNSKYTTGGFGGTINFARPVVDFSSRGLSRRSEIPIDELQSEESKSSSVDIQMEDIRKYSGIGYRSKSPEPP